MRASPTNGAPPNIRFHAHAGQRSGGRAHAVSVTMILEEFCSTEYSLLRTEYSALCTYEDTCKPPRHSLPSLCGCRTRTRTLAGGSCLGQRRRLLFDRDQSVERRAFGGRSSDHLTSTPYLDTLCRSDGWKNQYPRHGDARMRSYRSNDRCLRQTSRKELPWKVRDSP